MQTSPLPRPSRDPWLWLAATAIGAMLAALGVLRYAGYNADMFDLGNMAQAIASVRRGEPLVFTYGEGQMSRLALHVELFYFLLALPYALWPDPRMLIVAQAALYALGALPAYALAARRMESRSAGLAAALVYLLFPVGQTAVLLDIHGDTFAVPFLLFALDALDRRAWRPYALWLALALSCKFYVALPVAALGPLVWWCYGERRAGLLTALGGVAYGLLAFLVIRPLFTTAETSSLHRGGSYLAFYFGQLDLLAETAALRLANALIVFVPILLPLRRGWLWVVPGLPIIAAALLSTLDGSYAYGSHHYAIAVPFLVMAAIDGVDRLRRGQGALARHPGRGAPPPVTPAHARAARAELAMTVAITALVSLALVDTPLNPQFWMGRPNTGLDPAKYGVTSRDAVKTRLLGEELPPAAPVAASLHLAPHLADRETLYLIRYEVNQQTRALPELLPEVSYAVADALYDFRVALPDGGVDGGPASERAEIGLLLGEPSFGLVAARDGLLLFQRDPPAGAALAQEVATAPDDGRAALARLGPFELIAARVDPLEGRRFRATFEWRAAPGGPPPPAVAVSALDGLADARIVHLPSFALLPTERWRAGQIVRESFELELPADTPAGRYLWRVAWYDLAHSEAFATDERSRIGPQHAVTTIDVR